MAQRRERCGFGEGISEYVANRFNVPGRDGGGGVIYLQLTRHDLPKIAKAFELEVEVAGGAIVWKCRICGELRDEDGDGVLECDPEKHAAFYGEMDRKHRDAKRGKRDGG